MNENSILKSEKTEGTISISPKMKMTKRLAITICEQIINACGELNNYKRITAKMLQFSCKVTPEKTILFFRELDRNFIISVNHLQRNMDDENNQSPYYFKLFLTIPEK